MLTVAEVWTAVVEEAAFALDVVVVGLVVDKLVLGAVLDEFPAVAFCPVAPVDIARIEGVRKVARHSEIDLNVQYRAPGPITCKICTITILSSYSV